MVSTHNPYACFNRPPFRTHMKAADGHWDDGVQRIPKLTYIPFRMNPDCQYALSDLGKKDPKCHNCIRRKPT